MTVMKHTSLDDKTYEELKDRCLSQAARPCIYPISATSVLNSQIAIAFRDRLKRKLLKFLIDDSEAEEFLIKSGNKDILDQDDISMRACLLSPHVQTTLLINESIALEMKVLNGGVLKLEEPSGARKDRFTSCSYLNWFVSLMDVELLKEVDTSSDEEAILAITMFG